MRRKEGGARCIVYFLQVCIITDHLDTLLQGNDFIVASHHHDSTELQSFGKVHGADRDMAARSLDTLIENLERHSRFVCRRPCPIELRFGSDKYAELVLTSELSGIDLSEETEYVKDMLEEHPEYVEGFLSGKDREPSLRKIYPK